jgi:hypothetical protein
MDMREWIKTYCMEQHNFDYKSLQMDGSDAYLRLVHDKFYREATPAAPRAVTMATDGMYVTARFEASIDPQRQGVAGSTDLSEDKLTREEVEAIVGDRALFEQTVAKRTLTKAIFASLLIPVDGKAMVVPVLVQPAPSGAALPEVMRPIEDVGRRLPSFGFEMRGFAHDNERSYSRDLKQEGETIKAKFVDLIRLAQGHRASVVALTGALPPAGERQLFDLWHRLKNHKSAVVGAKPAQDGEGGLRLIPNRAESIVNTDALLAAGVLPYAFQNDSYRAMNDHLVMIVMGHPTVQAAFDQGDWKLLLWILPAYMAHSSNFNAGLSRDERVDRLTFVVVLALHFLEIWDPTRGRRQNYQGAALSREMVIAYVVICTSELAELVQNKDLWLASLQSHLDEHYFGRLRRLMGSKGSADDAMRAARKAFVMGLIEDSLKIAPLKIRHRSSDSGVLIGKADRVTRLPPLGNYMRLVAQLFELAVPGYASPWSALFGAESGFAFDVTAYVAALIERDKPRAHPLTWSTAKMLYAAGTSNQGQRQALAAARDVPQRPAAPRALLADGDGGAG